MMIDIGNSYIHLCLARYVSGVDFTKKSYAYFIIWLHEKKQGFFATFPPGAVKDMVNKRSAKPSLRHGRAMKNCLGFQK